MATGGRTRAEGPIRFCVLTVSDRCAAGAMEDRSGPAVRAIVEKRLGGECVGTAVQADEAEKITAKLRAWVEGTHPDLVLTTGGTGLGPRDVTPEATRRVLEREHSGLVELIRLRGLEKTPLVYLSRGIAGTCGRTLILNLPGSERGAAESLEAVVDVLGHAVEMLRGGDHHARVE